MGNFARRNGECHVTVKAGNTPCVAARQVPEQQEEPEAVDYELTDAGFGYVRVSLLSHSRAPSATQHSAQLAQGETYQVVSALGASEARSDDFRQSAQRRTGRVGLLGGRASARDQRHGLDLGGGRQREIDFCPPPKTGGSSGAVVGSPFPVAVSEGRRLADGHLDDWHQGWWDDTWGEGCTGGVPLASTFAAYFMGTSLPILHTGCLY
ncbi:hypothetical protein Purlil1_11614 [Purpureocillium lilacinum]|uniref:Uncharacterized protein n=1 Tax=Purpureocillium lilacinum TaxID=33203 RepID=A0ABR0BJ92_PURLI|nr:hypothetical protein Purlil1_11614 [Purpureocillium lilacinum]